MSDSNQEIEMIIWRVEETLSTARLGLEDLLKGAKGGRRMSGLRNLIVFGRSVTWVLQNLRSVVPEEFDSWYKPQQEMLKNDPLMRFFVDARNALEKQGKLNLATTTHLKSFTDSDMSKLGLRPQGATGFFIGDHLGGMGWLIETANGKEEKYYVEFPAEIAVVMQHFTDFPVAKAPELAGATIELLSQRYVERLSELVSDARNYFLGVSKVTPG